MNGKSLPPRNRDEMWLPTPEQELLLRASLMKGEEALKAWNEWKSGIDIFFIDYESQRLLPLLHENLYTHGVDEPLIQKYKGVRRLTWVKNQRLFSRMADILQSFHREGIETMVLKGAALAHFYYIDFSLRPMEDFDILVHLEDACSAIRVIDELGLEAKEPWLKHLTEKDKLTVAVKGLGFRNREGQELDLHWYILIENRYKMADHDFWEHAASVRIKDEATKILNPEDQLLHVCVHGTKWNSIPMLHWIADAVTIINKRISDINWDRFLDQTQKHRFVLQIKAALNYLKERFHVPVPQEVLTHISRMPVSKVEFLEYRYVTSPPQLFAYLPINWFHYLRYTRKSLKTRLKPKFMGFLRFLQYIWGFDHFWQVMVHVFIKTREKIFSRKRLKLITFTEVIPKGEKLSAFWHGTGIDREGRICVAIGNGEEMRGRPGDVLIFEYNTKNGQKRFLKSVRQVLKEEENLGPNSHWPDEEGVAKVHSDIFEYNGKMYFSTHDHHVLEGIEKHRGGHFISYDPETGKFEDLSKNDPEGISVVHEGIIGMNILPGEHKLVGWTFPMGNILLYDLIKGKTVKYQRGLKKGQETNVSRVVITTRSSNVFAAYTMGQAPNCLFKLDRKQGRLVPTANRFRMGFFEGLAETSDGTTIYIADTDGELYSFDTRREVLVSLGSILPLERTTHGERVVRLQNLTMSRDERKLFFIPNIVTNDEGSYHLYEYDIATGAKRDIADFRSVLQGSTLTGNGIMDDHGFMYLPFFFKYHDGVGIPGSQVSGIVRIDVRDRILPTASSPVFDPYGGLFSGEVKVTLKTQTPGAFIHYTTDGSDPTPDSALYKEPFILRKSAVVYARAFKKGVVKSPASLAAFILTQ